jgi:hypothetical protein
MAVDAHDTIYAQLWYTFEALVGGSDELSGTFEEDYITDRVEITSIHNLGTDHLSVGSSTTLHYHLRYMYMGQTNVGGTFSTDETGDNLVYQSGDEWQANNVAWGLPDTLTFDGFSVFDENQHGLTDWTFTGISQDIHWDRIDVTGLEVPTDQVVNRDTEQWVRVQFQYANPNFDYVTVWNVAPTISGPNGVISLLTYDGNGWWNGTTGVVTTAQQFDYDTTSLNDFVDVDNINVRDKNTLTDYTIWERLIIYFEVSDLNPFEGTEVTFDDLFTVTYEAQAIPCTNYEIAFSKNGLYWESFDEVNYTLFKDTNSVGNFIYTAMSITSEPTHGITVFTSSIVSVTWGEAGAHYYSDGKFMIESPYDTQHDVMVSDQLDVIISWYKYLIMDLYCENITYTKIKIVTDATTYENTFDYTKRFLTVDLSTIAGTLVKSVSIISNSDGVDPGLIEIDDLAFSPSDITPEDRIEVIINYETEFGDTSIVLGGHLPLWDNGILMIQSTDRLIRTETDILYWSANSVIVEQSLIGSTVTITTTVFGDGMIEIHSDSTSVDFVFAMKQQCEKYSDSFGVTDSASSDDMSCTPTFVAMYAQGYGFGVIGLTDERVTAQPYNSHFTVEQDGMVVLLPLLKERFEIVSGVEIDPNFAVTIDDIDPTGLLTGWAGTTETQLAAFIDGSFNEIYAVHDTFETQGNWIIDNTGGHDLSTEQALNKTSVSFINGLMNVTINANQSDVVETVVFELNYVSFKAEDYPFLRLSLEGDGKITVSLKVKLSGETELYTVIELTPDGSETEKINIHKMLMPSLHKRYITNVQLWLNETTPTNELNKTIYLNELSIYRIQGWELVMDVVTAAVTGISSVAESNGQVLTLRSEKDEQIVLKRTVAYVDATEHRIFQWRERVGYTSNANISAVGSDSTSYSIDDNANWAVISNDISGIGDGVDFEVDLVLNLTASSSEEGELKLDWIRIVAPFSSSYTWDSFKDATWTPTTSPGATSSDSPLLYLVPDEEPPTQVGITYNEHGYTTDNGDGTFTAYSTVGEQNTWNGTHWVRYIYNQAERYVKIGNTTIYHNAGGGLSIETDSGFTVGSIKWYVQAYYNDQWNNIILDNYQFMGFTPTDENVLALQRFWGSQGEMIVTTTYTYRNFFKTQVDVTNLANQTVPVRLVYGARDISGFTNNNGTLVKNEYNKTIGMKVGDFEYHWLDAFESYPDLHISHVLDRENNRAGVVFGDINNTLAPGNTWILDPTSFATVISDYHDSTYHSTYQSTSWSHSLSYGLVYQSGGGLSNDYYCFELGPSVPQYAEIESADLGIILEGQTENNVMMKLSRGEYTKTDNWPGESSQIPPDYWNFNSTNQITNWEWDSGSWEWRYTDVKDMYQDHVNYLDYTSGTDIAFMLSADPMPTSQIKIGEAQQYLYHTISVTYQLRAGPVIDDEEPVWIFGDHQDAASIIAGYMDYDEVRLSFDANDVSGISDVDVYYRWGYYVGLRLEENWNMIDSGWRNNLPSAGPARNGDGNRYECWIPQHWDPYEQYELTYELQWYYSVWDDHADPMESTGWILQVWFDDDDTTGPSYIQQYSYIVTDDPDGPYDYDEYHLDAYYYQIPSNQEVSIRVNTSIDVGYVEIDRYKIDLYDSPVVQYVDEVTMTLWGSHLDPPCTESRYTLTLSDDWESTTLQFGYRFHAWDNDNDRINDRADSWLDGTGTGGLFEFDEIIDDDPNVNTPQGAGPGGTGQPSDVFNTWTNWYRNGDNNPSVYISYRYVGDTGWTSWIELEDLTNDDPPNQASLTHAKLLNLAASNEVDYEDNGIEIRYKVQSNDDANYLASFPFPYTDDDCWYYYGGSGWTGTWTYTDDPSEYSSTGKTFIVGDDDYVDPEMYGSIDWSKAYDNQTSGWPVTFFIIEESGVSTDPSLTYLEITSRIDSITRKYDSTTGLEVTYFGDYGDGRSVYNVTFTITNAYAPGIKDFDLYVTDNDRGVTVPAGTDKETKYWTAAFEVFDDDDSPPIIDVDYTPRNVLNYNDEIVITFEVNDESTASPYVVLKYSIQFEGWQEVQESEMSKVQLNDTAYEFTFTIPEEEVEYFDGTLNLQLYIYTSDTDHDVVVDDPIWEYNDWCADWVNVEELFQVTDFDPPSYDTGSFTGPVLSVVYDDDNRVWVTGYEPYDASGISHGYINYTADGWDTFTVSMMAEESTWTSGIDCYTRLLGRIPLVYGSPLLDYKVLIVDRAGNVFDVSDEESDKYVSQVGDDVLPVFTYSRVVGAEPALNGTLVAQFYEPMGASGVGQVTVSIDIDSQIFCTDEDMTYNPETDTWYLHLPKFAESTLIEYQFKAYDVANPSTPSATDLMSYYVQAFTASITEGGERMNLIDGSNQVGIYRTMFMVETPGFYGFVPIYSGAVAEFRMWLDGEEIPNGAQKYIHNNVHVLLVNV